MKNETVSIKNVISYDKRRNANSPFFKSMPGKTFINSPNDVYEQEADAIAEKIMRMPANENSFFKPSAKSVQRKCAHCEEEEKQIQKKSGNNSQVKTVAPSIVNDVVHSKGNPLEANTKHFMESRFSYDFSNVQIHNDPLAHQSSSNINALAYTHGNHIVFGSGQYQPNTQTRNQLLAHELTHVVQQTNAGKNDIPIIQRKIDYGIPADDIRDPIPLVLNSPKTQYIALTTMTLNGKEAKDDSIIVSAFDASNLKFTQNATTGNTEIDNSNVNLTISANRILWKAPGKGNKWGGYYDRTSVPGSKTGCEGGPQMYVELNGKPDSQKIYTWIIKNEDDHVSDLKTAGKALEVYYDRMKKRTLPSCASQVDCEKLYKSQFEAKDKGIAGQFIRVWDSLVTSHDNPTNGKHVADSNFTKNDCDRAVIETAKKFP